MVKIPDELNKEKFWNIISAVLLTAGVIVLVMYVVIYQYPQSRLNPYPPPTLPVALVLPTFETVFTEAPSISSTEGTITHTPTGTQEIKITETSVPATSTSIFSAVTLTQTEAVESAYPYVVRGSPVALAASIMNSDRQDCEWMGLAGQIEDLQGRPVTGILIQSGGKLDGKLYDTQIQMSGTALNYGPAGYEFSIADRPIASKGKLWVLLFDQQYIPLSKKIYFDTYDDCEKNLIIINFSQVR